MSYLIEQAGHATIFNRSGLAESESNDGGYRGERRHLALHLAMKFLTMKTVNRYFTKMLARRAVRAGYRRVLA